MFCGTASYVSGHIPPGHEGAPVGAAHPAAVQEKRALHCGLGLLPYSQSSPTGEHPDPLDGGLDGHPSPPPDPPELPLLPPPPLLPPLLPPLPLLLLLPWPPLPEPLVPPLLPELADPDPDPDPGPPSLPTTNVEPPQAHIPAKTRTVAGQTLARMPSPPKRS
jgi:hypothetical protein